MARRNRFLPGGLAALILGSGVVFADGPRVPIRGVPLVAGQPVEAVVLLETLDRIPNPRGGRRILGITVPAGTFKPIAQDTDGYYYHAENTIQPFKGGYVDFASFKTGLYLSKTKPGDVYIYFGDPMRSHGLVEDFPQLTPLQVSKLRIGLIQRSDPARAAVQVPAQKP